MTTNKHLLFLAVLLCLCLSVAISQFSTKRENKETPKQKRHPKIEHFSKTAHLRPTKCQACRILMEELQNEVNNTKDIKEDLWLTNRLDGEDKAAEKDGKKIAYKTSELRLMDILESVCKNVNNYRSIAGPDFPYLKGVKSMFRQQLEESMGLSGLTLTIDAPEEMVEDPTFEIRRLHYQCNQLIEVHEDEIIDWYMHKQDVDPIEFLCAERILDPKDHGCLTASRDVPDFAKKPLKVDEDAKKIKLTNGRKMEL